jgi:hypothetical protein
LEHDRALGFHPLCRACQWGVLRRRIGNGYEIDESNWVDFLIVNF